MHASSVLSCHGQSRRPSNSPLLSWPRVGLSLAAETTKKLSEILEKLTKCQSHSKTTKQILLSLIGKLAFATQAVPAGKLFIRHLITLSMKDKMLHHHIHFNSDAQADIAWWQEFFCQCGMVQHNWLTNNPKMQQTWSYTKTLLARLDVVGTFKGSGFTTTSNHIISNMCLSNGKNSSQLSLQPSPGATFGGKSASDSTATTS